MSRALESAKAPTKDRLKAVLSFPETASLSASEARFYVLHLLVWSGHEHPWEELQSSVMQTNIPSSGQKCAPTLSYYRAGACPPRYSGITPNRIGEYLGMIE